MDITKKSGFGQNIQISSSSSWPGLSISSLNSAGNSRESIEQIAVPRPYSNKLSTEAIFSKMKSNICRRNISTGIGRANTPHYLFNLLDPDCAPNDSHCSSGLLGAHDLLVSKKIVKKPYSKNGKTYYLHHDGHEDKHRSGSLKFDPKKKKEFLQKTEKGAATFYPDFAKNYYEMLENAIKAWVDQGCLRPSYITFSEPIGADEGYETRTVELYYGGEVGSHMRPKYVDKPTF